MTPPTAVNARHFRTWGFSRALFPLLLLASGCSTIDYTARTDLQGDLKDLLRKQIRKAEFPEIVSVEVQDHFYSYSGRPFSAHVVLRDIAYPEIYSNHYVFVLGRDGNPLDKVLFGTEGDAKEFADVVMSLQARGGAPPLESEGRIEKASGADQDAIK